MVINSELVPKLESVDLVLVHCNLVNNSYQQASKVLFTFVPNKKYGQLINTFARNFGDKYRKKLMNTAIKTGTNFNSKYGKELTNTAIKTGKDFAAIAGKK